MNPLLAGRKRGSLKEPERTVLLYEGSVHEPLFHYGNEPKRAVVGLADGKCKMLTKAEFAAVRWWP